MARARRAKAKKGGELQGVVDPRAELDSARFLAAAGPVLKALKADLLARAKGSGAVTRALRARHEADRAARRTADGFVAWQGRLVEQVAAAWLLSCVFVRALEDRGLLDQARIAGAGAMDSQKLFFEMGPSLSERDYLLMVFRELSHFSAARGLFDAAHNPVWLLAPSAEAAKALLALFRTPDATTPAFRFGQADTRFLGDLYQDLDEGVRKRFALLQTPRFVESFILDRTLERAIARFGLDDTTLIDPTCGSGHFLLGAFERLTRHRLEKEPALGVRAAAERALDAVFGADINPYAVAIARFRLTLAFLDTAGYTRLRDAPALPLHLAVADSLLHNPQLEQASFEHLDGQSTTTWRGDEYQLEDEAAARDVLHRRYAAVVGNPPYITVKDAVLRKRYAESYPSCHMNYALTIPFAQRFFQLGRDGAAVGQITANSFMKREFGKKLITEFLPSVNLDLIVNTSGAFIPGHGTPTVLLFGTAEAPKGTEVHTVLAKRGEPTTPKDAEQGLVWRSIADHVDETGFDNDYISVAEIPRPSLAQHPWSLSGGGASDLKALLEERATSRLTDVIDDVGFSLIIGEDEVFIRPAERDQWKDVPRIPLVVGEQVRDWSLNSDIEIVCPFDPQTLEVVGSETLRRHLWPWRRLLEGRIVSGSTSMKEAGKEWYDVRRLSRDKHRVPLSITFAFVATHNHFVLDRGGKVFNRSAPIIKLPDTATEDDHYALLAYLNSSTACFWMKQVFFPKYGAVKADHPDPARNFYEFAGTGLGSLPLPRYTGEQRALLAAHARRIDEAGRRRHELIGGLVDADGSGDNVESSVRQAWLKSDQLRREMILLQEEIDWITYCAFGLVEESVALVEHLEVGELTRGQRAFEPQDNRMSLVRSGGQLLSAVEAEVETQPPTDLPQSYLELRTRRQRATAASKSLGLIETNVFKRLWRDSEQNETEQNYRARRTRELLTTAFISAAEDLWRRTAQPVAFSTQLSAMEGLHGLRECIGADSVSQVAKLLDAHAVPFLSALRFTSTGVQKHTAWQHVWESQRLEDTGETVADMTVPPKYGSTDYRSATVWRLRGKLDVPKERFISYPGCESDEDGEPLYGWAGWNHLEQAQALAALYQQRKQDGWEAARLTPMLAGLLELVPWVKQWHNEPSEEFQGLKLGDYFEGFVAGQCTELGLTEDDLQSWRPEAQAARARRKKG